MPTYPPFDPAAVVDLLQRFYAVPSAANLLHALADHPEVFAGAVPIGHGGDKVQLPDRRIFDCIFNVDGLPSKRRWQCIDVTTGGGGEPDPFALEPGPLDYIDETQVIPPLGGPSMESIAAGLLEPMNGADDVLAGGRAAIVELDVPGGLGDDRDASLEDATTAHAEIRAAIDADNPADVLDETNSHGAEITAAQGDYVEAPVPPQPVPDPGPPPHGHGGDDGGPPPA